MDDKMRRMMYGDEYVNRENELDAKLAEIEAEHQDWFNETVDFISNSKPARLHNYWTMYNDGNTIRFGFPNDTELPKVIQDKCTSAFSKIFS